MHFSNPDYQKTKQQKQKIIKIRETPVGAEKFFIAKKPTLKSTIKMDSSYN